MGAPGQPIMGQPMPMQGMGAPGQPIMGQPMPMQGMGAPGQPIMGQPMPMQGMGAPGQPIMGPPGQHGHPMGVQMGLPGHGQHGHPMGVQMGLPGHGQHGHPMGHEQLMQLMQTPPEISNQISQNQIMQMMHIRENQSQPVRKERSPRSRSQSPSRIPSTINEEPSLSPLTEEEYVAAQAAQAAQLLPQPLSVSGSEEELNRPQAVDPAQQEKELLDLYNRMTILKEHRQIYERRPDFKDSANIINDKLNEESILQISYNHKYNIYMSPRIINILNSDIKQLETYLEHYQNKLNNYNNNQVMFGITQDIIMLLNCRKNYLNEKNQQAQGPVPVAQLVSGEVPVAATGAAVPVAGPVAAPGPVAATVPVATTVPVAAQGAAAAPVASHWNTVRTSVTEKTPGEKTQVESSSWWRNIIGAGDSSTSSDMQ
jgi:hypothetical protein